MQPTAYDKLIADVTERTRLGSIWWARVGDAARDEADLADPQAREWEARRNGGARERIHRVFEAEYERGGVRYQLQFADLEKPPRPGGIGEPREPELRVSKDGPMILQLTVYDVDLDQLQSLYEAIRAQADNGSPLLDEAQALLSTF